MKYRGCAYYPEWEADAVEHDARRMREAGLNMVRIGEFAWCRMEPSDGRFTLGWLHEALAVLDRHGISILMCTPTATAPAWLTQAWPETLMVDKNGACIEHGGRQHTCYVSPRFREYCARITDRLSRELAGHKNVVAWQIDNEIGHSRHGNCHCEICQQAFREWLRKRYGSLENLNRCWGAVFWSQEYSDWNQVRLGDVGMHVAPSRLLDSARFFSGTKVAFIEQQAAIIRANHPGALVATNNLSAIVNRYDGFRSLDRAGVDVYPRQDDMAPVAFFNSLYRSVKPGAPFWVMEAGIGGGYYPGVPHNRRFRPVMWHHYANGAEMALVFLWRPSPSGYEQDHAAILDHAGRSRRTYRDLQACMLEFERLQPVLEALPPPRADVALVLDYDALWRNNAGHTASPYEYEAGYVGGLHAALFRRHQLGDVIPADRPLDGYKLVILPSLGHVERTFADRLAAYVAGGGVVLALGELGNVGPNAEFLNAPGPEHLGALFGLSLEGRLNLSAGGAAGFEGALDGRPVSGLASRWIGDVDLKGGAALLRFREGTYQDQPALVEKAAGKGAALYLAARQVDEASLGVILDYACRSWRSRADADLPARVERVVRGGVTFLINHSPEPADIPLGFDGRALVGTCTDGVARLAPYDVCAVEQAPAARPRRKRA